MSSALPSLPSPQVSALPSSLLPLPVGDSASLRVGQRCFAIGNPFGFDHTLTAGVVSGLNRDISSATGATIAGGVQTDAAINPGNRWDTLNEGEEAIRGVQLSVPLLLSPCLMRSLGPHRSGGPLLDSSGRLIGLSTAIVTATGTSSGVGFAIPSAVVARVVPQLIEFGLVSGMSEAQ